MRTIPRRQLALAVRDVVVPHMQLHGTVGDLQNMRFVNCTIAEFQLMLRTPFTKLSYGSPNLPWGLEIWRNRRKVLNLQWTDAGRVDLVSMSATRDWCETLITLANGHFN